MKNQSLTEIAVQILETANSENRGYDEETGQIHTTIMSKAYLNYSELKEFLKILTESGLITYDLVSHKFKITKKGLNLLEIYNKTRNVMKEEEQK